MAGGATPGWYARNRELAWSLMSGALLIAGWLVERRTPDPRWTTPTGEPRYGAMRPTSDQPTDAPALMSAG